MVAFLLLAGLGGLGYWYWQQNQDLPAGLTASYVGREQCIQCHQTQHEQWTGSNHDKAMDHARDETVLANFDTQVTVNNQTSKFFKKDGKFFVHTPGVEGKPTDFEVKYTFGVEPLQQYLIEQPDGRLQALPLAWDTTKKQWFHLYEAEKVQPHEWLYWTNRGMNWNIMCAECHSTNVAKNYDPKSNTFKTTWTDIDVSCEACHGPGSIHLQLSKKSLGKYQASARYGSGLAPLKSKDSQIQLDACGRCHSRRQTVFPGFEPGKSLLDHYVPELLDGQAYHPDGQIRDEDYEYGSFHLSLMYQKGVRCTDCHDPHTAKLKAQNNNLCIRCHTAGKYDTPNHHFHLTTSTGALCVNCHMPTTTYMRVDPRHDHSFRVPRPDLTLQFKTPNACNKCHTDRTPVWAKTAVEKWYGKKEFAIRQDFAATIVGGRTGDAKTMDPLRALARDNKAPHYVRASAVALLRNDEADDNKTLLAFAEAAKDAHPLVRLSAARGLDGWLQQRGQSLTEEQLSSFGVFLSDTNPIVRADSARLFGPLQKQNKLGALAPRYLDALALHMESQRHHAEDPAANHNLGNLYSEQDDPERAIASYERAILLDPTFNAARFNLAMTLYSAGRKDDARKAFEDLLVWAEKESKLPDSAIVSVSEQLLAQTHYHLGLLLAEGENGHPLALPHLQKSVELDADQPRVWYNLAIALQKSGKAKEAVQTMAKPLAAEPKNNDYKLALALMHVDLGEAQTARDLVGEYPMGMMAVGVTLHQKGNLAEAETTLRLAYKMDPKDSRTLGALGHVFADQKKLDQARELFRRTLELNPDRPDVIQRLNEISE